MPDCLAAFNADETASVGVVPCCWDTKAEALAYAEVSTNPDAAVLKPPALLSEMSTNADRTAQTINATRAYSFHLSS